MLLSSPTPSSDTELPADRESLRAIVRGLSWQFVLSILGRVLTFATALIQTHILGREGYGELGMVLSTITLFGLVSTGAGGQTSTKYIAELRLKNPERAGRIAGLSLLTTFIFSLLAAALLLMCANVVATGLLNTPKLAKLLTLAALAMALQAFGNTLAGILLGLQLYSTEAVVRFSQLPAWLIGTALLTRGFGTLGAMTAFTISHALGAAVAGFAALRALRAAGIRLRFDQLRSETAVLTDYSGPMMLHSLLCVPTLWACNAILARQSSGLTALGSYSAAVQIRSAVMLLPTIIQTVVWPVLGDFRGRGRSDLFERLFHETMRCLWGLTVAIVIAFTAFQKEIMAVFGKGFSEDHVVFGLCFSCAPVMLASSFCGLALQTLDRTWPALSANIAYSAASIALTALLAPNYTGAGMAVAFVLSTAVQFTVLAWLMSRESGDKRLAVGLATMLTSVLAGFGATYLTASDYLLKPAVQGILLCAAVWLVWYIRPNLDLLGGGRIGAEGACYARDNDLPA